MTNILDTVSAKPNYLRHPGWRWNIALHCLVEGASPEEVIRRSNMANDPWLMEACKFYQDREELMHYSGRLQRRFPVMHEAFMLFHDSKPAGGFKWLIEAMMMTEATDDQIATTFCPLYGAATVTMFRKVFFDIDHYKHSAMATYCTIFATALQSTHMTCDTDFTWKAFAYALGFDAIQDLIKFRSGGTLSNDYVTFMREISAKRRYYNEYHQSASIRASFSQPAIALFEQADRLWNMEQARKKLGGDGGNAAEAAAQVILGELEKSFLDPHLEERIAEKDALTEPTTNTLFVPDTDLEQRMLNQVTTEN
jgi:hypothetical protein